ncbi:hypothetical protein M436DRAFT_80674 [Aureobasidium namibiae CBS 147.97]|uniref:Uncharacterized protein n=1 Tax=Aureobasidium namibiae CBS 147.97 TaxID=1043004 RepID=A0A074XI23_9PEZI|nr:uncharacterized protein M436DRAFT_80674 [Aureobasidium namibiae CBS 147.97]KEQ74231.1 hypothetical protein M436DRAFT_80674 [Aureobasidium namibiae CBS 147.97]
MADTSTTPTAARKAEIEREVEALVYDMVDKAVEHAMSVKPPYIFPSGVPGFGNCILGPRVPRVSIPSPALLAPPEHLGGMKETYATALPSTDVSLPDDYYGSSPLDRTKHSSTQLAGKKRKLNTLESEDYDASIKRIAPSLNGALSTPMPTISEAEHDAIADDEQYEDEAAELVRLIYQIKYILHPYTQLHSTCTATEPLQKVYHALSSQHHTLIAVMSLIHDALEALRPLRDYQVVNITKLARREVIFQRAGLDSCLDARVKMDAQ